MKRFLLFSFFLMHFFICSCQRDFTLSYKDNDRAVTLLSIHLSGVVATRSVEPPGLTAANTIELVDGHIFIVSPLDVVTAHHWM